MIRATNKKRDDIDNISPKYFRISSRRSWIFRKSLLTQQNQYTQASKIFSTQTLNERDNVYHFMQHSLYIGWQLGK